MERTPAGRVLDAAIATWRPQPAQRTEKGVRVQTSSVVDLLGGPRHSIACRCLECVESGEWDQ